MLTLRPVTIKDAELLLEWRNDPTTRQQSRDTSEIALVDHISWLEKTLSGAVPTRKLLIAENDGAPVGTVRSDEDTDGYTEISYTVSPNERGKGYGKQMVTLFVREQLNGKKIKTEIKKGGNEASENIARSLGLNRSEERASEDSSDTRPIVVWH